MLFRNYSFQQGLNTYNIYKTYQDEHGFIWIVTQDGAYRFNGRQFEVFKKNNAVSNSLNGVAFMDMAPSKNRNLLFAGFNSGIEEMQPADLHVMPFNSLLPNLWIKKIFVDSSGTTWVGGKDYFAWKAESESAYTVMKPIPGFKDELEVNFIRPLNWPYLAVGISGYGTLFFNMESQQQVGELPLKLQKFGSGSCIYFDFLKTDGDTVYAATSAGLVKGKFGTGGWVAERWYPHPVFNDKIINSMIVDRQQRFWIATNTGLISYDPATAIANLYLAEKEKRFRLQDNSINHLMLDNQNNLWISTSTSLQRVSLDTSFIRYFSGDLAGSDPMAHVYSLVKKNDHEIFATGTDGLYLTNLHTAKTIRIPGSASLGLVHHIEEIEPDFWILSCYKGMFGYVPSRSEISQTELFRRYPEWRVFGGNNFNDVHHEGESSYWASEETEGLIKWNRKLHEIKQFKNGNFRSGGLPENHIHNLNTDREGNLWLLMDNSVAIFDTKIDSVSRIISYNRDRDSSSGFDTDIFFDIYDDGQALWFGTFGGGLNAINKKTNRWTYITEKDGLCNNCVYSILPENDSVIWVSTNMGISRVHTHQKRATNYFIEDGLQDNSFDEKGKLALNNKLYFGGINGFTEIDLNLYKIQISNFPVYCQKVEYYTGREKQSITRLSWDKLTFPPGTSNINMYLAALSYADNQKIRFSYKVEGLQEDYIDVSENNTITLNTLSYGDYSISIRYRQEDGSFGSRSLGMHFYIQPKWYQTWWFKILLLILFGGILYGFYLNRIAQIKKEEKMRRKIAGDLHDDIGSTLNSIKVFTSLSLSKPGEAGYLQQIREQTQNAIISVRDMMWVLNDKADTVGDVVLRFEQFAGNLAMAREIQLEKKLSHDTAGVSLKKDVKRNLYLILKEAFNNSIKYAEPRVFGYSFQPGKSGKPTVVIWDDGKGFDATEETEGYGLKSMHERADQIGYALELSTSPGGTRITLRAV